MLANEKKAKVSANLKIWAYYRLGMYNAVVETQSRNLNWRAYFAKIIAYAALGKNEEAKKLLETFYTSRQYRTHGELLVKALAPYMADVALGLKDAVSIAPVIELALLIKVNDRENALKKAEHLIEAKVYRSKPELLLYYSNLTAFLARKKLTLLNIYLAQYNLTKVRLKDKNNTLSVKNLSAKSKPLKNDTLVSIIVTTYNSSGYIETALHSILSQSYSNIEVIVVDDASSDHTVEIIETFVKADARVRLIKLSKNVGTYVAKNIALDLANGEFVTCHDSDDWSHPLKIEKQVMVLIKDTKLLASISYWVRIDENGKYYTRYVYPLGRLNMSSLMYRKEKVLKMMGYYDSVRTGADSEFYARMTLVFGKKKIKRVKLPLSFGAHRENSLMTEKHTGYCDAGISSNRLQYWESWNHWHIQETAFKRVPFVDFGINHERAFEAPKELIVKYEDIERVKRCL